MDGNEQSDANSPWQYRPEGATSAPVVAPVAPQQAPEVTMPRSVATPPTGPDGTITWTASEFVAHQKSSTWYVLLTVGALVVTALIWIVTKDVIAAVVILFAVGAFGIIAARQPRDLSYQLDQSGLTMGTRHHAYKEFRSYSIMSEGAIKSVVLVPLKRF